MLACISEGTMILSNFCLWRFTGYWVCSSRWECKHAHIATVMAATQHSHLYGLQVALEDPGKVVAKLQQAAQSFTKYDGQVLKLMLPRPQLLLPSKAYMISAYIKVTTVPSGTA